MIGGLVDDAQAAYFMADLLWIIFTMLRSFFGSMLGNEDHLSVFLKCTFKRHMTRLIRNF